MLIGWLAEISPWLALAIVLLACGVAAAAAFLPGQRLDPARPSVPSDPGSTAPPGPAPPRPAGGGRRRPVVALLVFALLLTGSFCALTVFALIRQEGDLSTRDRGFDERIGELRQALQAETQRSAELTQAAARAEAALAEAQARFEGEARAYEARIATLELQGGENDEACLGRLERLGLAFTRVPDRTEGDSCAIRNAVRVERFGDAELSSPATMTCRLAELMTVYERDILQPVAQELFQQKLTRIDHVGTYNCRTIAGMDVLSEHAFANGIDLSGFAMADGQSMTVLDDWDAGDLKAEYMRRAAYGACTLFPVALTPEANEAHANHLHLDAGRSKGCR